MTDELLTYGRDILKQYGLVDSGDAALNGIGMMTKSRWKAFFDVMAADNVFPIELDYTKAYTLEFVGKRVGIDPVLPSGD
jgi:NitT/TauT family transport system substrate-binding protein